MIAFTLPQWLERIFGAAPAQTGEGTQWSLATRWTWPYWLTLLLVVFCYAFVAYLYYRERRSASKGYVITLGVLRVTAITLALLMIAGVMLMPARTGLPYVVVLFDVSTSMSNEDTYSEEALTQYIRDRLSAVNLDKPTRINLAKTLLLEDGGDLLRQIEAHHKLKFYFFSKNTDLFPGNVDEFLHQVREVKSDGTSTRLGAAVRTALNDLRGTLPSAIILLTDGVNTDGESLADAARYARDKNVPLLAVGLGSDEPFTNLKLSELTVDEVVYVDDIITLECQLTGPGLAGRRVEAVLQEVLDGNRRSEKLASVIVQVPANGRPKKIRLRFRPDREEWESRLKAGENYVTYKFVIEVEAFKEEKDAEDNVAFSRPVRVVDEKIRVLLAQSYPSFEFKFIKALLEREDAIELTTVLQEADPDWAKTDKSARREHVFPVRAETLNKFDVIIFGDVNPEFLDREVLENIARFVKVEGHSILFIAGPRFTPLAYRHTPLAPLFPVDLGTAVFPNPRQVAKDSFRVRPTPLGLASPHMQLGDNLSKTAQLWSESLNSLHWLMEVHKLSAAARVLAEHPRRTTSSGRRLPIFIEQYYGSGMVLFHATDETHRWRFRLPDDLLFRRYWIQTLRYLSRAKLADKNKQVVLTVDRDSKIYERGETVRFRARFSDETKAPAADDGVTIFLEREGRESWRIKLHRSSTQSNRGIFEGSFDNAPSGKYHSWIASPAILDYQKDSRSAAKEVPPQPVDFIVKSPPGESALTRMNSEGLKLAAGVMKSGRYYTFHNARNLVHELSEGEQVVIERMEPFSLWNWWPVPLLLLGILMTEWTMRKRKGLL